MKAVLLVLVGLLAIGGSLEAQPALTSIVNGASFSPSVPRGCLISIFGTGLARSSVKAAATPPLPKRLDDTVVLVGDLELEAPLYFVSPTQINAQLPFEVLGDKVAVVVSTAEGKSRPFILTLAAAGPGILTQGSAGKGRAPIFGPSLESLEALTPGEPMIFYAAGLGPTDPPVLSGNPGSAVEPFNRVTIVPEVFVGEAPARVTSARLAPGQAGIYEVNVIPQTPITDRLWIRSRGRTSNIADVPVRPGQNITNASGSIELVYPTSQLELPITYSAHLVLARFTARFDITPSAGPFLLNAIADGDARSVVTFDPENGSFQGVITVPAEPPRHGDFSNSGLFVIDLLSCHRVADGATNCHPFAGNIIPFSRIPREEFEAATLLPLPNTPPVNSATGEIRISGEARRGSTFVINSQSNSRLATFAGYISIEVPPTATRTVTLKLFVDGRSLASLEVPYKVAAF